MNPFIVFQQMLVLLAMVMVGYYLYRKEIITEELEPRLSYIVVNALNPILVISSITDKSVDISRELIVQNIIMMILLFAGSILLSPVIVRILRMPQDRKGIYYLMTTFSNLGFMGLPIISALFGKGATIYVAFYMLGYNVLLYTYGLFIAGKLSAKKEAQMNLKKLLNPGVFSCIIAIALFSMQIEVPIGITTFCSYMGNAAVPFSMMLIGGYLAKTQLHELVKGKRMYAFCLLKLLLIPIGCTFLIQEIPFDPIVKGVFLIMASMPVGSIVILIANDYGIGGKEGVQGILLTTMLSLFTLPIVAMFFQ